MSRDVYAYSIRSARMQHGKIDNAQQSTGSYGIHCTIVKL
jgi:hypothetical protein